MLLSALKHTFLENLVKNLGPKFEIPSTTVASPSILHAYGCNACRYSACDVIILSQTGQLAKWLNTSLSAREVLDSIFGPVPAVNSLLSAQVIGAEGLGFDSRDGQIGTVSPTACHRCDVFVLSKR